MIKFSSLKSRVVPLLVNDIDTDQIIPARFLKLTDKAGLGEKLFSDWRYDADGSPKPDFALNASASRGAQILLTGDNFGCGSSREHAPWALTSFGFRAVISTSFADIFRNNAMKNGLLPIIVDAATHRELSSLVQEHPDVELAVDLASQSLRWGDERAARFPIDAFAKSCLLNGTDELGYILQFEHLISAFESSHPSS
jgi:3-isopropylmalate/(R)-2-methylmalate dehydratase small subunit